MTKKQILNEITTLLKESRQELCVSKYPELRQPNRGFHAYTIRYNAGTTYVYPWATAKDGWELPLNKITKPVMETLLDAVKLASEL